MEQSNLYKLKWKVSIKNILSRMDFKAHKIDYMMDCHFTRKKSENDLYVTCINFSKNLLEVVCIKFPCCYCRNRLSLRKILCCLILEFSIVPWYPLSLLFTGVGGVIFLECALSPEKNRVIHAHIESQNPAFSLCVSLILFGTN